MSSDPIYSCKTDKFESNENKIYLKTRLRLQKQILNVVLGSCLYFSAVLPPHKMSRTRPWNSRSARRPGFLLLLHVHWFRYNRNAPNISSQTPLQHRKKTVIHKYRIQLHYERKYHFYRPQRSWAKVIFLQAFVCPQGGVVWSREGVWSPIFRGGPPILGGWGGLQIFFPFFFQFPPPQKILLGCTPPETVNARPVRILLECILVN